MPGAGSKHHVHIGPSVNNMNFKVISFFFLIVLTFTLLCFYGYWTVSFDGQTNNLVTLFGNDSLPSQGLQEKIKSSLISSKERQLARKQHLKEYCLKHTFNKHLTPEDQRFVVAEDNLKIIYCRIPKVATKTWTAVITRSLGRTVNEGNRWKVWKRFDKYTENERSVRLKTHFKFLFVREPLQRLLSAYKDRFIKHSSYTKDVRKEIIQTFRRQDFKPQADNAVSFREFIQYFSDNKTRNEHWRQYDKLCHPCVINYDFIGHLETMEEDAALLLKMAGIDSRATFPPIHNSTRSSEVLEYYSQVPVEDITRIGELYRSDFEMFGYEYLGPVKELLEQSKN